MTRSRRENPTCRVGFRPHTRDADRSPRQDENGVDLSLICENLRLSPIERLRKAERARTPALRLQEYGRRQRPRPEADRLIAVIKQLLVILRMRESAR